MTTSHQSFTPQPTSLATPSTVPGALSGTALVLGGGGSTGNAWLIGVIAALTEAGMDVSRADLVVGTSAGSTAAAQISGASPARLLGDILSAVPPRRPPQHPAAAAADPARTPARTPVRPVGDHLERTNRIIADSEDAADLRRRLGAAARDLAEIAGESAQTRWRATVASRLPSPHWPHRRMLLTAVDAHTGEPVVFDRHSDVELADAVAASCASGFAYRIGDHAFIDGGYRSNADNADLAAGYARVLVLSPFGGRSRTPAAWGLHLAAQVENLRAGGSSVETIVPSVSAEHLFGANAMDASLRPPAARAGYEQGRAFVEEFAEFWH
ncbi:patatin-like phospholipase family protein [Cryobacterium sp. PAMC25264]|uniref:patatin-like phospholipase family protein n=1 Tax=Cryobacterium sp. PAMC25264 TaxID=2861288 RepID=UPI001C62D746|nr:patatin-like phospholipase family protein [Cryobacterium sp. PAMC25264]QYF74473.1 patatin-like phospholipase family protein [Cryobacterium sp. PAMC25264]